MADIGPAAPLTPDQEIAYTAGDDLSVELSWDFYEGQAKVDLDCSAVVFDDTGTILDAVYFKQLSALDGALKHSGDNTDGTGDGPDETIKVDLDSLPSSSKVIMLVVNAFEGGTLEDVESAEVVLKDINGADQRQLASISIGAFGKKTGLIVGALYKDTDSGTWKLRSIQAPVDGRDFQSCKEEMRKYVDTMLDEGMKYERMLGGEKVFDMKKGDVGMLPGNVKSVAIGLGWTTTKDLDLDASCYILDAQGHLADTIMYSKQKSTVRNFVTHSGDNTTGDGDGDDETINVRLDYAPKGVDSIVFVVNVYTSSGSFAQCRDSYICLRSDTDGDATDGKQLARYTINSGITSSGLVFAKLFRSRGKWGFKAIGQQCTGRKATDQGTKNAAGIKPGTASTAATTGGGGPAAPRSRGTASASGGGECCRIL